MTNNECDQAHSVSPQNRDRSGETAGQGVLAGVQSSECRCLPVVSDSARDSDAMGEDKSRMLITEDAPAVKEVRNTRGFGSVKPFGDKGQWRARLTVKGNKMSKVVNSKGEGLRQINIWLRGDEDGTLVVGSKSELQDVITEWLAYEEARRAKDPKDKSTLAQSTLQGYQQKFDAYILFSPVAKVRLSDLTGEHIGKFVQSLTDGSFAAAKTKVIDKQLAGIAITDPFIGQKRIRLTATKPKSATFKYSYSIGRQSYAVIRDALRFAVERNYVNRNVALDYSAHGAETNAQRDADTLTVEQEKHGYELDTIAHVKILDAINHKDHDRLKARWLLSMRYGLRPGEVLGICLGDIDWKTGELTVRRQVQPKTGKGTIIVPRVKTPSGKRTIPLDPEMLELLKERRTARRIERRQDGWEAYEFEGHAYDLLFTQVNGRVISQRLDGENWARLLKTAKVPHVRRYVSRHNAASQLMAMPGADVIVVADLMGHKDPSFTMKRYSHALKEKKRAAVDRMGAMAREFSFDVKERLEREIGREEMIKQGITPHEWDEDGELIE